MSFTSETDLARVVLFDRAIAMRDAGDYPEALLLLEELVGQLTRADTHLLLHSHLQIVHILTKLERGNDAGVHARFAVEIAPMSELASLARFHVLNPLYPVDALTEAVRLLSLRESLGYRELFEGDAYTDDVPREQQELAKQARQLLAKHRDTQQRRTAPVVRDTVRIRASAPPSLRPGSLASVQATDGMVLRLEFSDGEVVEAPATLVDHRDI